MHPTREQIDTAAYQRWQRRGGAHGHDRDDWLAAEKDLVFAVNYRYVARYKLADPSNGTAPILLGKGESTARPRTCRFNPSCSEYTAQAIAKYGVVRGVFHGMWRILRCNPFNPGGFDPIK